jgi:hypothetical protein
MKLKSRYFQSLNVAGLKTLPPAAPASRNQRKRTTTQPSVQIPVPAPISPSSASAAATTNTRPSKDYILPFAMSVPVHSLLGGSPNGSGTTTLQVGTYVPGSALELDDSNDGTESSCEDLPQSSFAASSAPIPIHRQNTPLQFGMDEDEALKRTVAHNFPIEEENFEVQRKRRNEKLRNLLSQ